MHYEYWNKWVNTVDVRYEFWVPKWLGGPSDTCKIMGYDNYWIG
jgi:hypothetical protein